MTGLEPANNEATIHCLNPLATSAIYFCVCLYSNVFDDLSLLFYLIFYLVMLSDYILVHVNGKPLNCLLGFTVKDLLLYLDYTIDDIVVEHNCRILQNFDLSQTILSSGDKVEIVTIVGGG